MVDDNISPSSSLQEITVGTQTSMLTTLPSPSLAHQLPLKLTNFFIVANLYQPNSDYHIWVRVDQLVLSWIIASIFEGILRQLAVQKVNGIAHKLTTLQHPFTNDNLFEFVLARLGPAYRAFTRSL
ncbi:hypothetical protein R3W88_026643 [Solanum pinnatisectum]|uniref:Uncharacterized protein n=1 Tax=Solanum pinnatisectum TaxID=50273 RepID=A0AAV9LDZ2_9SOLN|nr:hypothetical protein R3W88_026643 [Solanum pinnatisectum]